MPWALLPPPGQLSLAANTAAQSSALPTAQASSGQPHAFNKHSPRCSSFLHSQFCSAQSRSRRASSFPVVGFFLTISHTRITPESTHTPEYNFITDQSSPRIGHIWCKKARNSSDKSLKRISHINKCPCLVRSLMLTCWASGHLVPSVTCPAWWPWMCVNSCVAPQCGTNCIEMYTT